MQDFKRCSAHALAMLIAIGGLVQAAPSQTIIALAAPSWGTVMEPTSGTVSYSLSTSTGLVSILSGVGFLLGDSGAGSYLVTGTSQRVIAYSVSIGAFSGTGISASSAFINGTSSSGSAALSLLGTLTLSIGGVLNVAANATAGTQTATVTVTVNYP